jgi:hypothetical protein
MLKNILKYNDKLLIYIETHFNKINNIAMNPKIQVKEMNNGDVVYYSIVEKESEKGLSFNKRLFFLMENQFFGYLSSSKDDFAFTHQYFIDNAKVYIELRNLTKIKNN